VWKQVEREREERERKIERDREREKGETYSCFLYSSRPSLLTKLSRASVERIRRKIVNSIRDEGPTSLISKS